MAYSISPLNDTSAIITIGEYEETGSTSVVLFVSLSRQLINIKLKDCAQVFKTLSITITLMSCVDKVMLLTCCSMCMLVTHASFTIF